VRQCILFGFSKKGDVVFVEAPNFWRIASALHIATK
jgi:hypothetical protein